MNRVSQLAEFQVTNVTEYVSIMRGVRNCDTFPNETLLTIWTNMLLIVSEVSVQWEPHCEYTECNRRDCLLFTRNRYLSQKKHVLR
jgi:hypothetical protein